MLQLWSKQKNARIHKFGFSVAWSWSIESPVQIFFQSILLQFAVFLVISLTVTEIIANWKVLCCNCAELASTVLWFAVLWQVLQVVLLCSVMQDLHPFFCDLLSYDRCLMFFCARLASMLLWFAVLCSTVQDLHPFYCDMQSYDSCLMFFCAGLASILLWFAVTPLWQRSLQVVSGATEHSQTSHWQVSAVFCICW